MGKKKQLPAHVYLKGRVNKYLGKCQDSTSPEFYAEYAKIMSGKFPAFPDIDGNANKRTFNNLAKDITKRQSMPTLAMKQHVNMMLLQVCLGKNWRQIGYVFETSTRHSTRDEPSQASFCNHGAGHEL